MVQAATVIGFVMYYYACVYYIVVLNSTMKYSLSWVIGCETLAIVGADISKLFCLFSKLRFFFLSCAVLRLYYRVDPFRFPEVSQTGEGRGNVRIDFLGVGVSARHTH